MTALTDRDLELIEVALDSAISATGTSLSRDDGGDLAELNREYRGALGRVQRLREEQA